MEKRPTCEECKRPLKVCMCPGLPETPVSVLQHKVVILQHPSEKKQAFSSVRVLQKCIDVDVKVGREFQGMHLDNPVVVFPSKNARNEFPQDTKTLVFLDGTWNFAKKLYNRNPWLHSFPTVVLNQQQAPLYAPLRNPPKPGLISTAEAVMYSLQTLGEEAPHQAILNALTYIVDKEVAQQTQARLKREVN